jgi:hypothetical protein
MNDINVKYSKNDFLYYKLNGPKNYDCDSNPYKSLDANCSINDTGKCSPTFIDNICKNKQYAENIIRKNISHSGSDELYNNTTSQYNIERLSFVNLGIGIIIGGMYIMNL